MLLGSPCSSDDVQTGPGSAPVSQPESSVIAGESEENQPRPSVSFSANDTCWLLGGGGGGCGGGAVTFARITLRRTMTKDWSCGSADL